MTYNENTEKLEAFLQNYGNFVSECPSNPTDLDTLMKDLTTNLPPPPQTSTANDQVQQLYKKGLGLTKESTSALVTKLRSLKEQKLQDLILNIEQLHVSLNNEYEKEINRAVELRIYNRSNTGS